MHNLVTLSFHLNTVSAISFIGRGPAVRTVIAILRSVMPLDTLCRTMRHWFRVRWRSWCMDIVQLNFDEMMIRFLHVLWCGLSCIISIHAKSTISFQAGLLLLQIILPLCLQAELKFETKAPSNNSILGVWRCWSALWWSVLDVEYNYSDHHQKGVVRTWSIWIVVLLVVEKRKFIMKLGWVIFLVACRSVGQSLTPKLIAATLFYDETQPILLLLRGSHW